MLSRMHPESSAALSSPYNIKILLGNTFKGKNMALF